MHTWRAIDSAAVYAKQDCQRNSSVMMKTVCLILKAIIDNLTWFSYSGFMFSVIVLASYIFLYEIKACLHQKAKNQT